MTISKQEAWEMFVQAGSVADEIKALLMGHGYPGNEITCLALVLLAAQLHEANCVDMSTFDRLCLSVSKVVAATAPKARS